jgi:hypothetical protein
MIPKSKEGGWLVQLGGRNVTLMLLRNVVLLRWAAGVKKKKKTFCTYFLSTCVRLSSNILVVNHELV